MTGLTKAQERKIRSLAKQGKTQRQIAKLIHKQKLVITKYMQAESLGKRKVTGSTLYWKDVKAVKQSMGIPHKEASEIVFKSSKWITKRTNRLPYLRRLAVEKWQDLDNKARAMRFREFKRGEFKDNVGVRIEDYNNYFDSD